MRPMTKDERATIRMIAKELDGLSLFNDLNLILTKQVEIDTKLVRQMLDLQYAKLRRMGYELKTLANGD